jgi:NAD(P)-dependent dehydrogenase (short-subunit alcohol dehydrogenase family)
MNTQDPSNVTPIEDWNRLLDGRVAVVSGGGKGNGAAVAHLFAKHGAVVEIAEIDPAHGEPVDVTDEAAVARFAQRVLDTHGRVDVLVNNVGDYRPLVRFPQSSPASWSAMYDINLKHVLLMTHAFIGSMIEHHRGSIVNIHSVEGMRGYPGDPVYGAMKAGAAHFTTCLAASMGRNGVRVNGIGPDLTQTPQVDYISGSEGHDHLWEAWAPVGRLGWPQDQARVALFLASDMSGFVTGHNIPVDGGTLIGGGWFFSPEAGRFVNRPTGL